MKEDFDKLLSEIDVEIAKIDLYGNDIIETSLSIVRHLLEKPRDFDPFGHAGLSPLVTI